MTSIYQKTLLSALLTSTLVFPSTTSMSSAQATSEHSAIAVASTAAAKQVFYQFGIPSGTISGPAIVKNGITYMDIRSIAESAGLKMEWDKSGKRVQFSGWTKSFTVQIGSSKGVLDGKTVDLGGEVFPTNSKKTLFTYLHVS